jgi:hypothetical protein
MPELGVINTMDRNNMVVITKKLSLFIGTSFLKNITFKNHFIKSNDEKHLLSIGPFAYNWLEIFVTNVAFYTSYAQHWRYCSLKSLAFSKDIPFDGI